MPTLVTMSDTSSAANKEAPTAETTMPTYTVPAGVAEDFAIWLRLDSKPGKNSTPDCLQDMHGYGPGHVSGAYISLPFAPCIQ